MSKSIRFSAFMCITTLLIKWTNSYVLLAANLEDFKKVAKKFVPEKLAMQIANIATASPMNGDYYDVPDEEVARVQEDVLVQEAPVEEKEPAQKANQEEEIVKRENDRPTPDEYEDNAHVKQLDFEALVQQVKERLEQDILKKKQIQSNMNQQAKSYASIEPEDMDKRIVERKRPERYTKQRYREEKRPEKNQPQESEDKYSEERYPKINRPQGKRPTSVHHKEESYIDQEDDSPRQQTKNKGRNMQHNRDIKQSKDREEVKLSETLNEEYENPHGRDEMDQSGKVVHNHHEEKQRHQKHTLKFNYAEQLRTVSPDTHGKYKQNENPPVDEYDETLLYTKVSMIRNDSYEDYVTPKKEKNVYASYESNLKERAEVTNIAKTAGIIIPLAAKVSNEYEEDGKDYYYNDNTNDPKARTENLDFNYDANQETERKSSRARGREHTTPMVKVSSSTQKRKDGKKGKATMIPKRDFYKISSPNYYAKIPIVAEKYDFNEPIPEKDREPEDTRSFPMPPSAINGKVKVQ